ncbi:MAG: cupin domain-containing protein [Alphaproteobacteria bacterium]|jgi:mannose-6-phosphate isomerase-like protein (cupin superfamily)|nr:cupin domain-containing protein [Rhodospirillaceae bacterium]MDG2482536.1 cupin domain-containing protein [Alphaproteobacteria bacterium]MBT6205404.1 cupin domain-containing protein [Rhodospirillaceae bacterium]MBT6511060.1 cupin domain-containing protein [Rhodospirillaceae bacterium]MBT7612259.1 cupin domain-containing protein [Rhodospirillaceae bacterium]
MIEAIKVSDRMAALTPIRDRGEHTTEEEVMQAFAKLGEGNFLDCAVFLGSFNGNAGWERHMKGDELVHVMAGSTEFDIIVEGEKQTLNLDAGMLVVVPRACWHRFRSEAGVTVLTATPQHDEIHTFVEDPRDLG